MLVPVTRAKLEQLIPAIATGSQYLYYWGKWRDVLRRFLISFIAVVVLWVLGSFLGPGAGGLKFLIDFIASLYWLWSPVYWASLRNTSYRKYQYGGFWRGRVLDVFVTDDLVREEETVNQLGELVIIENRERRINLEVGDETGFRTTIQAPLLRIHKGIVPGDLAEAVLFSDRADLSHIVKIGDLYLPRTHLWVGEYPCTAKDVFVEVSEQLRDRETPSRPPSQASLRRRRR